MTPDELEARVLDIISAKDASDTDTCNAIISLIGFVERIARLSELQSLKKIDCFNTAYTSDPRPAKHIDIRLNQLKIKG